MTFTIGPRHDENAFLRLMEIGFITSERGKRTFANDEWFGKKDAKGNIMVKGVNPVIRHRLMVDHRVEVHP